LDADVARGLAKTLEGIGVESFLDEKDIGWGDPITQKVSQGLRSCSALIVILSPGSLKSQWVPFEIGQATALGKKILPYLTHPALDVPMFIRDLSYKTSLDDVCRYFREVFTVRPEPPAASGTKVTPKQRDAIRAERNKVLVESLKAQEGVTDCTVFQLEDHTDKGYLVYVHFDDRQSAAGVLSLIRRTFEESFPDLPVWGETKTESDNTVSFAYTYIDEHNKLFKP
jgi:hypothetical protein